MRHLAQPLFLLIGISLLIGARPSVAQVGCESVPGNRLANCGFEEGDPPERWTVGYGTDYARATISQSGSFSASLVPERELIGHFFGASLTSDCFSIPEPATYRFGASLRRSVATGYCSVMLRSYSDADCRNPTAVIFSQFIRLDANEWFPLFYSGRTEGPFGEFILYCSSAVRDYEPYLFDDAIAAPMVPAVDIPAIGSTGIIALATLLAGLGVRLLRRP